MMIIILYLFNSTTKTRLKLKEQRRSRKIVGDLDRPKWKEGITGAHENSTIVIIFVFVWLGVNNSWPLTPL